MKKKCMNMEIKETSKERNSLEEKMPNISIFQSITPYYHTIFKPDSQYNKFAKLSKARRDHWPLLIEDHKSLMKVGTPQKYFKLKKFKVKKFLSGKV